jgi:ribosomal protein S18 acetylase RimI-like enzyme
MREFEPVEQNLRVAMRFFGEATGVGQIETLPGATAIYSGLDYGVFNIAVLDGPTPKLEPPLAECARYFLPRTTRWSFWLCEDLLDRDTQRRARSLLLERGLYPISHAPGMLAPGLAPATRRLPEVECVPVTDQSTRQAFGAITAVSFDIPMAIARAVYYPERAWNGAYRGFVGMVKGRPVSIVAIVASGDSLGIYSLATMPEDRHRGYGEALLRAAVASEQQRTGIQQLVLQSTEAGYSLYRHLAFRDVAQFSVYLTK